VLSLLALAACDSSTVEPAAGGGPISAAGAATELTEYPFDANFPAYSGCLESRVTISGTVWWSVRTVTRPDGSQHLTINLDVSAFTISDGGSVWTARPGATEIYSQNISPEGFDQQMVHQGTVIYQSEDGRPDLRLVHRIHLVRLPGSEEVHLNAQTFEIVCVAPEH
jgi:hypothetical protein